MIKKLKPVKTNLEISQEPNSPVMKLIKETGIEGIALDVIKGIMSPLINLIRSQANNDSSSSFDNEFNKSITLIAASDPKNQLELMLATQLAMTHHYFRQKRTAIRPKLQRRSNHQQPG